MLRPCSLWLASFVLSGIRSREKGNSGGRVRSTVEGSQGIRRLR